LGNIAGEDQELREILIKQEIVPPLIRLLDSTKTLVKVSAWALSNVIKGPAAAGSTEYFFKSGIQSPLLKHLKIAKDEEVLCELVWLLAKITARDEKASTSLVGGDVIPLLVNRMHTDDPSLLIPILTSLGNIISHHNDHIDTLLSKKEVLGCIKKCLQAKHRGLQREAAWILSLLTDSKPAHIDVLVGEGFIPPLCQLFVSSLFDIRRECAFSIYFISREVRSGRYEYLAQCMSQKILTPFLELFQVADAEVIETALSFVELVLRHYPGGVKLVEENNGIESLETLQTGENNDFYGTAQNLIDEFYGGDIEEEVEDDEEAKIEYPPWRLGAFPPPDMEQPLSSDPTEIEIGDKEGKKSHFRSSGGTNQLASNNQR